MERENKKNIKALEIFLILILLIAVIGICVAFYNKKKVENSNKDAVYYKLSFDSNGGSSVSPIVVREGYVNLPTSVFKEGYRFVGWVVNNELAKDPYYVKEDSNFYANWHSDTTIYKLTLELNGGIGDTMLISTSKILTNLSEPKRVGHIFNGWYTEDNKLVTFPYKLSTENKLYADWIPEGNDYVNVTFNSGEYSFSYKVQKDVTITPPLAPYKEGYELVGWYNNDNEFDFSVPVSEDIVLEAKWSEKAEKYYVVSFDVNGSSDFVVSQMILEGEKALIPTAPKMEGYQFAGWELDGNNFDFNSSINSDINLKAKWLKIDDTLKKYNISFNLNGGTGEISNQTIIEGAVASVPDVEPSKAEFTFGGWYYDGKLYDFNLPVTKDIVLEAKWYQNAKVYYSIIFDLNDGGTSYSQSVLSGKKIEKPADPVREGYTFDGWMYNENNYDFNSVVTRDMTLVAHWSKTESKQEEYRTVSFDLNGGGSNYTKKVVSGSKISKPSDPVREEYVFKGWYYNGKTYDFSKSVNSDITLVAQWNRKEYTVSFDLSGGGSNYTKKVFSGDAVAKPGDPVRDGYKFNGWNYNGKTYNFNSAVKSNITLVAQWIKVYEVVFNDNNGNKKSEVVTSGSVVTKPDDPSKSGYTFLGWYANNKEKYDFNTEVTSNTNLYALWAPKLNYQGKLSGTWIYVNNPDSLNSEKFLADDDYGKKLLSKSTFKGTAELFYSHTMKAPLAGNSYYAIRIYNPNSSSVNLKINSCGAATGTNSSVIWRQYYSGKCNLAKKSYTIAANRSIVLFHSKNSFIYSRDADQDGVAAISGAFEGVLNMTASNEVYVANLVFRDIEDTYNAVYEGNYSDNISGVTNARTYTGTYLKLPVLTQSLTYEIYDQTPSGELPVSYVANNGITYVTSNKQKWTTNVSGGTVSSATNKAVYYGNQYVGDFVRLAVPTSASSSFTLGPYKSSFEKRKINDANGNSIYGWPYDWKNLGVHYQEKITIKNNSSSSKTVTFKLINLSTDQTIGIYFNNAFNVVTNKKGSYGVWTKTIEAGETLNVPVMAITLCGRSVGGVSRAIVLA